MSAWGSVNCLILSQDSFAGSVLGNELQVGSRNELISCEAYPE